MTSPNSLYNAPAKKVSKIWNRCKLVAIRMLRTANRDSWHLRSRRRSKVDLEGTSYGSYGTFPPQLLDPTEGYQEWPRQTKPKKGQFMNLSQGHSGTKVQCESCLFSQGKPPEFTKKGEIHELFVLALSLVWFAGATPEVCHDPTPSNSQLLSGPLNREYDWEAPISHPNTDGSPQPPRSKPLGGLNRDSGAIVSKTL